VGGKVRRAVRLSRQIAYSCFGIHKAAKRAFFMKILPKAIDCEAKFFGEKFKPRRTLTLFFLH
jgi:hypothetical protein